jgi:N6-L-threonylcarbamoyladenine synthase
MLVLGIETSCDETSAAVVDDEKGLLSNVVLTQLKEHEKYGGVVPEIAARSHLHYIDNIVKQAMEEAGVSFKDLSCVAATGGPGLIGGVMIGVMSAKAISLAHKIPFLAVNHLEGHALMARLTNKVEFPYLLMLTSGGHCQILIVEGVGKYKQLGSTIDDAAGEAFDKTAKIMGLGYPGGPKIEQSAKNGDANRFKFPRPLCKEDNCNFSFSGLKTAVRLQAEKLTSEDNVLKEQDVNDISASLQKTIADVMVIKLQKSIDIFKAEFPDGKDIVVSGGCAANQHIRDSIDELAKDNDLVFSAPPIRQCTDNGAMIAWAGMERFQLGLVDDLSFAPRPRWPL